MNIAIAGRYRPYSRDYGAMCLVPRTSWAVQAFPAMIRLLDAGRQNPPPAIEIPLGLHGLFREFFIQMDLEKGCVFISGIAREGRFRLRIEAEKGKIWIRAEKTPDGGIAVAERILQKNESSSWDISGPFYSGDAQERLSLGCHRSQDWAGVWRRMDLREILPVLFHLSQWTPAVPPDPALSITKLEGWEEFLRAGFGSILIPRLRDPEYQGLLESEDVPSGASPCSLLSHAREKIRNGLIVQHKNEVSLLPASGFIHGRFTNVRLPGIGTMDLEWTKGSIRRISLRDAKNAKIRWRFPSSIRSYRLRESAYGEGCRKSAGAEIGLAMGKNYYLDRFQK